MVRRGFHAEHPAHRILSLTHANRSVGAAVQHFRLHYVRTEYFSLIGNIFLHGHRPGSGTARIDHLLLARSQRVVIPSDKMNGQRLRAHRDLLRIRHHVDDHIFPDLSEAVFHGHHDLPVVAGVMHRALHRLLRRIDFAFSAPFADDDGDRALHHHNGAFRRLVRARPVRIVLTERHARLAEHIRIRFRPGAHRLLMFSVKHRHRAAAHIGRRERIYRNRRKEQRQYGTQPALDRFSGMMIHKNPSYAKRFYHRRTFCQFLHS